MRFFLGDYLRVPVRDNHSVAFMTWARQNISGAKNFWHLIQDDWLETTACGLAHMQGKKLQRWGPPALLEAFLAPRTPDHGRVCRRCQLRFERLESVDWQGVVDMMEEIKR